MSPEPRVVVIGGGFGGLYAVRALKAAPVVDGSLLIGIAGEGDMSEELWTAQNEKSDLFAQAFGVDITIRRQA